MAPPCLSVIVPVFNEREALPQLYSRLADVLSAARLDYEILLINDGSNDGSVDIIKGICQRDRRVRLVSFSRNFGHQMAVSAGLDRAAGQAIVIIDADLQDPPEVIHDMIAKWRQGAQVVYGVRKERVGETLFKRTSAAVFYRMLRALTRVNIPVDTGDFRLMDRRVVDEIKRMPERARFIRGMVGWVGFRQSAIEYVRDERIAGVTKYSFLNMWHLALDAVLSFSHVPLRFSVFFGLLSSAVAFFFLVYGLIRRLLFPEEVVTGWTSLFEAILFLGGVQLLCVGVLGEYLARVYDEVKQRPPYIIDEEINFP